MSPVVFFFAFHLLVCASNPTIAEKDERTAMTVMLDDLESLMTGKEEFDREYLSQLRSCMEDSDPVLTSSQDNAWQGIKDYWNSNGSRFDSWGNHSTVYMESNETITPQIGMTVYEPCGHSSNVAYYHSATEICARKKMGEPFSFSDETVNGLVVSFSGLAMGSSFLHMSHTYLGQILDRSGIRVLSYLIHQATVSSLTGASPVITDLSHTKRKQSAFEIVTEFKNMYKDMPVDQWARHVGEIDVPDYELTFAGIIVTCATVGLSAERADQLIYLLLDLFYVPEEDKNLILYEFTPEIRNLTTNLHLNLIQKKNFLQDVISTMGKLIYAFLWQEEVLTSNPIFFNETANSIGNDYIPILNGFLNDLNTYDFYEQDFQDGVDVYPGDFWCNPVIPHAKWHLESALGLVDLAYLADIAHRHLSNMEA